MANHQILHLKAPGNWMNDPNGFIYYKGRYHLFYQYFPYAPVWGTMHWGHAVSDDLLHWEHLGVALFPTKEYDQNGIFSGSAVEKDGKLHLYYTAIRYLKWEKENIHKALEGQFEASQALVISEDGYHFDNWKDKRQIIPVCRDKNMAHPVHMRDPKVWKDGSCYYMVLGSTWREKEGLLLFFRSKDGVEWEYVNRKQDRRFGRILECPDLFPLQDTYVLISSPMYIAGEENGYPHHAIIRCVEFDRQNCRLAMEDKFQYVDYGLDLYAPQTTTDEDGRRVMIGWMRMPKAVEAGKNGAWNGMMCIPRVVEIREGHIYFRVHPNILEYFSAECTEKDRMESGKAYRIKTDLREGEALDIGGYKIWLKNNCLHTDRSAVMEQMDKLHMECRTPGLTGGCRLDIFVEPNLIEIFVNEGAYVISSVVYSMGKHIKGSITYLYTGEALE